MRRRSGVVVAVALLAVLGLGTAASAGAGSDKPLTKKQFITEADKVCSQGDTLANDLYQQTFPGGPATQQTTPAQVEQFGQGIVPILRQEHDGIAALHPPNADKAKIKKLLKTLQRELDKLEADPQTALSSTAGPLPKATKLAKAYGFKVCGGGG